MALSALLPRHCFGFRSDVHNSVHWIEDGHIVYPAGHTVVVMNVETKQQRFIPGSPESDAITAIAVSPNLKFLAVAERAERAFITVFDLQTLKRRKTLITSEAGNSAYLSLCFSADSRLLLAQGAAPEWNLMLWMWEKSKLASHIKSASGLAKIYQCGFCPGDSGVVSVLGSGSIKLFRTPENNLKAGPQPLTKRDPQEYLCHAWLADGERDRMLIGCASGDILLVEALDLRATFQTEGGAAAEVIIPHSKGFIVGQANGAVSVFERDEKDSYRRTKVFACLKETARITSMSLSADESQLAVATDSGRMYTLAIGNMEILKQDEDNFELLAGMELPSQGVTGLDCCVRKPIIATCSTDRAVRLWNWQDESLELVKYFQDEAHSIAIHPSGSLILVGFTDKLRLFGVLMDDLRLHREFPIKQCRHVSFSNGGHLFAACNSTLVQIYSTYTCEHLATLRGHNGKVQTLHWSPDDSRLVSAGADGAVYEWRLADFKRDKEHVAKGCSYAGVAMTEGGGILAVGSDARMKELEDQANAGMQVVKEVDTGEPLTALVMLQSGKNIFAGTAYGGIRTYKYPLSGDFSELRHHASAVTRMRVFWDESLLITAGEDGSVFVFDVKQDIKGIMKRDVERLPFAEEVMVTKSDLEERRVKYQELETKYNEVLRQNQVTIHIKDLETHEKIKALTDKFAGENELERQRYDTLQQQKVEAELELNERLRAEEEKRQQQLAALDTQYQAKIMAEVERYQALMQEKQVLNEKWDEQNALLVESHERVIQELTEEYEFRLQEEQMSLSRQQQDKDTAEREFEEIKTQLEEDADRETEELREKYEARLETEKKIALNLKGENGLMRKKFNQLQKDIDDQREELREMFEKKKELYATIGSLEKDIAALKKEIRERDDTIADKEKRIYDLKKKNQELEKFKFVLDHKIKELKKQVEPKEAEIADMKDQIQEMDQELERYHKTNAQLDLAIADNKAKQEGLRKEILAQRRTISVKEDIIKGFQHDLHNVVQSVQDPKELKEKVKSLYQKHITSPMASSQVDTAVQREYNRQRDYLEKTVQSLKNKLEKDSQLHRTGNLRIMQENVALVKEINELRREIKLVKSAAARGGPGSGGDKSGEATKELEMQREVIAKLRDELDKRDDRIAQLEAQIMPRPMSRERLPPMEGFKGGPEVAA